MLAPFVATSNRESLLKNFSRSIVPASVMMTIAAVPVIGFTADFGPSNPFYAPSALPFQAPPFDRIADGDYQPAIEAGMRDSLASAEKIARNPAAPTFDNTLVALERSGRLLSRAAGCIFGGERGQHRIRCCKRRKLRLRPNSPPIAMRFI